MRYLPWLFELVAVVFVIFVVVVVVIILIIEPAADDTMIVGRGDVDPEPEGGSGS